MHPPPPPAGQTPSPPPPSSPVIPSMNSLSLDDDDNSWIDDVLMLDEVISLEDLPPFPSLTRPEVVPAAVPVNPVAGDGVSEVHGGSGHPGGVSPPDVSGFENPAPLPVLPAPPVQFGCGGCQVLREITHINGNHVAKLEIHGTIGFISHGIHEDRLLSSDWSTTESQYSEVVDFSKKSLEGVKDYLTNYCEWRRQNDYAMERDPLLSFYEALCVGLTDGGNHGSFHTDNFFQPCWGNSGENQVNQAQPLNQIEDTRDETRLSLAEQRERTKNMTLKDLMGYFHLPIEKAAEELRVCPTSVKKVCRKYGLERWPHRKIKSFEKKISDRRRTLDGNNAEERARAESEIKSFEQELATFYQEIAVAEMSPIPPESQD